MRVKIEAMPQARLVKATLESSIELDHTNAMIVREDVVAALTPGGRLILDFGSVRSVDSAGVGALVAVLKAVRRTGGRMVLIGMTPPVMSVLKTIRLTTVFEICADEAAAQALLDSTPASR